MRNPGALSVGLKRSLPGFTVSLRIRTQHGDGQEEGSQRAFVIRMGRLSPASALHRVPEAMPPSHTLDTAPAPRDLSELPLSRVAPSRLLTLWPLQTSVSVSGGLSGGSLLVRGASSDLGTASWEGLMLRPCVCHLSSGICCKDVFSPAVARPAQGLIAITTCPSPDSHSTWSDPILGGK